MSANDGKEQLPVDGRCARCHHPRGDHGGHSNLIFCYAHDAYHPSGMCDCPEYEEARNA